MFPISICIFNHFFPHVLDSELQICKENLILSCNFLKVYLKHSLFSLLSVSYWPVIFCLFCTITLFMNSLSLLFKYIYFCCCQGGRNKKFFFSDPVTKALTPPLFELSGHIFLRNFFRASKKSNFFFVVRPLLVTEKNFYLRLPLYKCQRHVHTYMNAVKKTKCLLQSFILIGHSILYPS